VKKEQINLVDSSDERTKMTMPIGFQKKNITRFEKKVNQSTKPITEET
jgi:hypothetical protein